MGKHLSMEQNDDQFEDNHPGCMWGIIHALDYHQWCNNVKMMLPHKKQDGQRHSKGIGSPKTRLNVHDSGEVKKLLDAKAGHFLVHQTTSKTSSSNKRSFKARIKALVAEDISKEEDHKQRGSNFPERARLRRTYSFHHLEPTDHGLGEMGTDRKHPIIFFDNNADTSATRLKDPAQMRASDKPVAHNQKFDVCGSENVLKYLDHDQLAKKHSLPQENWYRTGETAASEKLMQPNQLRKNASSEHQLKEYVDVLEVFKVNKDLFLKNLHNTDDGKANCFHSLQASNTKARLTKSGSYPVADWLRSRNFRRNKLKHKQTEIWSFPKGERLLSGTQAPKLVASKFSEDLCTKSGPLMADDSGGTVLNQESSFSSFDSTRESDKQGSNEVVIPLNDIKLRIELAAKKGKNESDCASVEAHLHGVPNGYSHFTAGEEMDERWKERSMGGDSKESSSGCHENDGYVYDLSKGKPTHIRRTSSLNKSLKRYAQLFEYSFSRKDKWHLSKSLKLTNEYEIPSGRHAPISFRRICSLPHLDLCSFGQNEESCDTQFSGMPIRNVVDSSITIESSSQDEPKPVSLPIGSEEYLQLDANEETQCLNSMVERSDIGPCVEYLASSTRGTSDEGSANMDGLGEEMDELKVGKSNYHKEKENILAEIASNKHPQTSSVSVIVSSFEEEGTILAEFPISEGLQCRCNYFGEKESSVNSLNRSDTDFSPESCSTIYPENFENANKSVKNHRHVELYKQEDADFNFVRDILERSGFTGNDFYETWYSSEQPLNPSVLEEVEACCPHEPECSGGDINPCCHHQLLFDLVNDVLLQIYERSFTYHPRALSSCCRIHPMPVGYHVLEEASASIKRSLDLKPELDQSLDWVVAEDLAKDNGWMNLQWESECVALDLEDLIFDELLEEVLCSFDH